MKKNVIKRLRAELRAYRENLVAGAYTVMQLYGEAYKIVMKQEIVDAVEMLGETMQLPDVFWNWLNRQESILDYVYELWADCDYTFSNELMELLYKEVEHDMEVHSHE